MSAERVGQIRVTSAVAEGRLRVRIIDNGVGMNGETLDRIFERFSPPMTSATDWV